MKHKILAIQSLLPAQMEVLEDRYDVIKLWKEQDPESAIKNNLNEIEAIVSTYDSAGVSGRLIRSLPNLSLIAQFGVGIDNIDIEAAKEREVYVTSTPGILTADTADIALSLMLACARRVCEADMFVRVGRWNGARFPLGTSMKGKIVGILGLGRIGQAIAKRAEAFEMEVVYYGRTPKEECDYPFYGDLIEMAKRSDFLVLACAGNQEMKGLVDYGVLEALGPKGYLINIARGFVVKQQDLLIALANRAIAGAGLDVYENEPNVPQELVKMDNVVLLPHIGSATTETRTKMGQLVLDNLEAHFSGESLLSPAY